MICGTLTLNKLKLTLVDLFHVSFYPEQSINVYELKTRILLY